MKTRTAAALAALLSLSSPFAFAQSVVYTDAFDATGGWPDSDRTGDLDAVYTTVGGEYLINPLRDGHYAVALAPARTSGADQVVEADIRLAASQSGSRAGVACRVGPGPTFYAFNLVSDGSYEIVRVERNSGEILHSGALSGDPAEGMRVRAECRGASLSMAIDGRVVASIADGALPDANGAGLLSVSPVIAATNAAFDNFALAEYGGAAVATPPISATPRQVTPMSPPSGGRSGAGYGGLPVLDDMALYNDAGGEPGSRQSLFDTGSQKVYVVMEMSGATRARFRAEWRAVNGSQESVLLNSNYDNQQGYPRVWLSADRYWGPGLYRVDVYANDRLLDQREFSVY